LVDTESNVDSRQIIPTNFLYHAVEAPAHPVHII